MRVLGISGSLRRDSYNAALLRAAAERLPDGVEIEVFERLAEIPPYDSDLEGAGEVADAVTDLRERMRAADAVLIATPEYNSSIPGALKNALDWASRPAGESALMGTPAAVIGASTGMFGAVLEIKNRPDGSTYSIGSRPSSLRSSPSGPTSSTRSAASGASCRSATCRSSRTA